MYKNNALRQIGIIGIAMTLLSVSPLSWSQATRSFEVPSTDTPFAAADLEILVGPIALYADDLVGIVLPASTYPLQIVQANRFLDQLESDPSLQPDPSWDSSVVALLNYPEILRLLDTNIEWTWALGEAVLDQQAAVMDAIQLFRQAALQAGNLASDDQQIVTQNDDLIEIAPADPEVIYIPYYEPERVVVVQPRPVIHYYSDPYPLYYYPYPFGYSFSTGFFWGVTTAFHIGWHSHAVHVYHYRNRLHPYFGRTYYSPYYARRGINVNINVNRIDNVWQPRQRRAARPRRLADRPRVTVSREGPRTTQRSGTGTVTRSNRPNSSRTQVPRTRINRNDSANRDAAAARRQQTFDNARANTQRTALSEQRRNRITVQQRSANPPRGNAQRSDARTSNRANVSPARPGRTFASPPNRATNTNRATSAQPRQPRTTSPAGSSGQRFSAGSARAPRSAPARSAAPAQPRARASGAAARSGARSGGNRNAGRTRR
jgi:hypothetical protein